MPEWLTQSVRVDTQLSVGLLAVRLIMAAVFGTGVAAIYRFSHGRMKPDTSELTATLVLLSIFIAIVSMVIGESVARAFSLVGALSIVRFRTVVDDTRDTAFVIFAVITGMATGTGLLLVPLVGIPWVAVVAVLLSHCNLNIKKEAGAAGLLTVRLGLGREPEILFQKLFELHLASYRLVKIETARQGAAIELGYRVQLHPRAVISALVADLNRTEGVQSASLQLE